MALLIAAGIAPANAQTQWTGTTSTDWFTPGNWNPTAVPGTGTSVQINTILPNATVIGTAGAQANQLTLGNNPGQVGNLTVDGPGTLALTNASGFFLVGNFGNGDVTVTDGGVLTTFSTAIGNQTGSTAAVTVTGAGSQWNLTPIFAFHVGSSGTGTLDILDGGRVTATGFGMDLGVDNLASGTVTVSGADSRLTVPSATNIGAAIGGTGLMQADDDGFLALSTVNVGLSGQGTLNLSTGADLTASQLTVGANAQGDATFNGAGTTAGVTNAVRVGVSSAGTLDVEAGATMTSGSGQIGINTGATGAVTVTGTGSQWAMTGSLTIGQATNSGTGTLDVLAGGIVGAGSFTGHNSAEVTVDGAGSQLGITNGFTLGATGAANMLDVTDGASFSAGNVNLLTVAGSGVTTSVTGTGTTWTATNVNLGGAGNASFTASDNAAVNVVTGSSPGFLIDGSNASLTITTGADVSQGDLVANTGQFTLGRDASGTLSINSGGTLSSRFTVLGENAGSSGDATVTGAGSTWNNRGVQVGFSGGGELDILAGASVQSSRSSTLAFTSGSTASVLVSGAGSQWVTSEPPPLSGVGNITVGLGGTATLRAEDGALIAAQGIGVGAAWMDFLGDGNLHPGMGTFVATGADTRVNLNVAAFQSFDAGGNGGTGVIQILDGAVATVAGQGHFGQSSVFTGATPQQLLGQGTLTVDGIGSRVTYTQTLDIGEQATGILNVQNGGFVSNSDGYLGSFVNAVGSAGNGTATVTGVGSTWQNSGSLRVGDQGTGTLDVLAGGLVTNTSARIANAANSIGTATVDGAGSTWTSSGTLAIGTLGTGILDVTGAGTVNSGAVSINALSTLNIGTGGVAGTLNAPSVASAGLVHFNHTGAQSFAAPVSGTGIVVKDAAGITMLSGASTYSGNTTVNGGIFRAGSANAFSANSAYTVDATLDLASLNQTIGSLAGAGLVTLGTGTLTSGGNDTSTVFSGNINGGGGFVKDGAGMQTFSGVGTYLGPTTVAEGTLAVNGSLLSASTVNDGARLQGIGTLGQVTVLSGGVYAPGNSIGTQTVVGPFTLNAGAIYEVEVNAAGQGDRVVVNGTVSLSGAVLRVLAENGTYAPSTSYLIIDNDGVDPVSGTFGSVTADLAFLTPNVLYDAGDGNDVVLTLARATDGPGGDVLSFCSVAETRNQCSVATALDRFPTDNPLFLAVLSQTVEGARQAFDALSGEVHATVSGVLADDSRYVREAVLGRLMQAGYANEGGQLASLAASGPQVASLDAQAMALGHADKALGGTLAPAGRAPLAFWTRAYGAWGDYDGNANAASASRDLGGFVSGMDARVAGTWRAGIAAGAAQSNIDVDARYSSAEVESFHLAGYAGGMAGPFAVRTGGTWAWNDIDTSRAVIFPGFFERENASYDADTGQIFGEVAYPVAMGRAAVEPFAGLAFVSIDTDSFRENGELAALTGRGTDQDVGYSTLGLRAATTRHWSSMIVTPHVSAAWQHAFDDVTPSAALAFSSTGIGFGITGVPLAQDSLLVEAGLDLNLTPNATLGVSYAGQIASDLEDNAVKGRLLWLF